MISYLMSSLMRRSLIQILFLLICLTIAGTALAQVSTHFDLGWHLLSGGGGARRSATYQLDDVLGQWPDGRSASDHYQVDPGFWTAGRVALPPPAQTARIFMPAQENTPGRGWKIGQQVQNAGMSTASVELFAYSAAGAAHSCGLKEIAPGESANYQTDRECAAAPWDIAAALFEVSQPAVAIANISNWGSGGAGGQYRGTAGAEAAQELFFPLVKANHYGRTTTFEIQNAAATTNQMIATFRVNGRTYTRELQNVPPNATVIVSPLDAGVPPGNGQVGSLIVTGTGPLAGVSVEHEDQVDVAANLQASRAFAPSDYDTDLYCPLFRSGHSVQQQTTGAQVQNVTAEPQQVTFLYTPQDGSAPLHIVRAIAAGASETFYAPSIGIPRGSLGSVTLHGEGNIAAVVNDQGVQNGGETATTYACFSRENVSGRVLLPLYKEFYLGNTTGIQVQNAAQDGRSAHITAAYYPIDGSSPVTFTQDALAQGRSITFWGVSSSPMPPGLILVSGDPQALKGGYGSVVVESDTPIAVMANESVFGQGAAETDSKNYEGFNMPD